MVVEQDSVVALHEDPVILAIGTTTPDRRSTRLQDGSTFRAREGGTGVPYHLLNQGGSSVRKSIHAYNSINETKSPFT